MTDEERKRQRELDMSAAMLRRVVPPMDHDDRTLKERAGQMVRMHRTFWAVDITTKENPAVAEAEAKAFNRAIEAVRRKAPEADGLVDNYRGITLVNYALSDCPCFIREKVGAAPGDLSVEMDAEAGSRMEDVFALCMTRRGNDSPQLRRDVIWDLEKQLRSLGDTSIPWDVWDRDGVLVR